MRRSIPAALAAAALLIAAPPARAAWITDGTPLWQGHVTSGSPRTAPDGVGGFIVSMSAPSETTFFRFGPDGAPASGWPALRPPGLPYYQTTGLAPDGAGGAYFAATLTSATSPPDVEVRVFHLEPGGGYDPAFGSDGLLLASDPDNKYATLGPDGDGGALVTWTRYATGTLPRFCYGSRITAAGLIAPGWPVGGAFIAGAPDPEFLAIGNPVPDGAGGFLQYVEGVVFNSLPYGQTRYARLLHYDGIGQAIAGWPAEGLAPPGLEPDASFTFLLDGAGGAYFGWSAGASARLLHVTSAGGAWAGWPAEGLEPCPDPGLGCYASGTLEDGAGGVWLALQRQLASPADPFALTLVRFDPGGALHAGFPAGGVVLPPSSPAGFQLALARGPGGSCVLLWGEFVNDGVLGYHAPSLHATRVEPGGAVFALGAWSGGALAVCTAPGGRDGPQLVEAPGGALFAVWRDSRDAPSGPGAPWSLYATRIAPDGGTNVAVSPGEALDRPLDVSPNPARGGVELGFALGSRAACEVAIFDVAGRRVRMLASESLEAGPHSLRWDGRDDAGRDAGPGLFFARAKLGSRVTGARMVRLR